MPLFLAVGVMNKSGLMETLFVGFGSKVKPQFLTIIIVFIGIMSKLMSDAGLRHFARHGGRTFHVCGA
jgi:p-aminobenzoyl-glutamate transporter AbgT